MTSEGTRFTKSKHEASKIFAKEHNLTPLKHHLIPRTKGFTTCLPILKQKCPTITNLQLGIVPSDNQPTFGNLLKSHKQVAHLFCKRISIEEVPNDEKAAAAWLHKIYQEKDLQHESFVQHGNFCHVDPTIKPITLKPRLSVLVNSLLWMLVTIVPIFYYILKLLFSGEFLFFFMVGSGVFGICKLILYSFNA